MTAIDTSGGQPPTSYPFGPNDYALDAPLRIIDGIVRRCGAGRGSHEQRQESARIEAGDPATAASRLLELAPLWPEVVASNAALPVLALSELGLWRDINGLVRAQLAFNELNRLVWNAPKGPGGRRASRATLRWATGCAEQVLPLLHDDHRDLLTRGFDLYGAFLAGGPRGPVDQHLKIIDKTLRWVAVESANFAGEAVFKLLGYGVKGRSAGGLADTPQDACLALQHLAKEQGRSICVAAADALEGQLRLFKEHARRWCAP